ncbi:hypothetical protein [Azospirillum picis]|uniref:Uncharacterized protein n=1 Tax=Azospirillum picis TaxID=488438 RepID=A0ABU0MLJ4_9PROT|nr:hypothetical protein [Azospirillum picis]MBP2301045.1 hypothetical protein [Azospirillum picis]MDQ0534335.1 hypothetical protein [Azospirillum picis]
MGLISFVKKVAGGQTGTQKQARYDRANARAKDYMEVVQWYAEETEIGNPRLLQNYGELAALPFRQGHAAVLVGYRNDIERKLGHARHIGTRQNPWISAFLRPVDDTVYCAYVLLRDDNQQFAVMKPYWFLAAGETEAGFRRPVFGVV